MVERVEDGSHSPSRLAKEDGPPAPPSLIAKGDVEKQSHAPEAIGPGPATSEDIELHFVSGLSLILLVSGLVLAVFIVSQYAIVEMFMHAQRF